ncbi:hypothetical protein INT48_007628 [Thamnidium elegans]|uniref:Rab-GAP TBC domain-containing protein n=1 Tax=Thamnidium elegans TaxID=101142 RepID=A0A8H7SRN8_9FUNG|nr:hypothetical protein INT48_007628 [Thamnidium elegans]
MKDEQSLQDSEFGDVDLSGALSSTHLASTENLTADKLLDELTSLPAQNSLYSSSIGNSSRNTYDQFFEEVSLDLPRQQQEEKTPPRLIKFMPRRTNTTQTVTENSSSDIGPFYSISNVLDDTTNTTAKTNDNNLMVGRESGDYESIDVNNPSNPRAARRNVNEAEVIATSGGTSMVPVRRRSILNPFKRNKAINQKPSPLETVISKTRPRMLPPKNPQEEKKHLQEYENMMKKARKLEAKKQKEHYRKKEEKDKKTMNAIQIWENEIIPQWKSKVKDKRTRQLWDQGVPPRCRKKVWRLKIGNELNITRSTFLECQRRVPQAVRTKDQPVTQKSLDSNATLASETPSYRSRRQRRTSSLDVLREHEDQIRLEESDGRRSSMELRPSSSTSYSYQTESDYNPEENHKRADSFSGRSAMELESNRTSNDDDDDDVIELDDDDDDDTTSQEDEGEEGDDDEKILTDPTAINFLNKAIDEDILRTLPSLCVFQPDGPLFMSLRKVLHAYVGYRPSMTYSRGASFLAGVLLLNMNAQETFISLINMIRNSEVLSALYNSDEKKIQGFFKVFNVIFAENLPKLYLHFKNLTLTPDNYLPDWFMTVFASMIPLELSSRLWDIYLLHGDIILFRTGLVVLKYLEPLLWGGGFSETVKILNMGFVGEHRGEEVKAALAVSGHITDGDEDPFFDEILGRKGVYLDETRFNELLGAHMPRST